MMIKKGIKLENKEIKDISSIEKLNPVYL